MNTTKRAHIYMLILTLYILAGQTLIGLYLQSKNTRLSLTQGGLISQYLLIFLPAIIYFIVTKSNIKETLRFKKVSALDLLISFGVAVFLIPLMMFINVVSQFFAHNYIQDYVADILNMNFFLLLFIIAITPAIVEEVTFRGIILKNYKHQTVLTACIVNGLLFGIFHGNLNQFLYATVLGFAFAYVLHLTGSIIPPMLMHFTINASTVTLQRVMKFFYETILGDTTYLETAMNTELGTQELLMASGMMFFMAICALPLAGLLLYVLGRRNNKTNLFRSKAISGVVLGDLAPEAVNTSEKAFTPLLYFIFIYFVGYVALFEFILPAVL